MMASAIEVYNRETNGFLIGIDSRKRVSGRIRDVVSVYIASPFQEDERKPTSVEHGNKEAYNRLIDMLSVLKKNLIRGYHSHPFPDNTNNLSKGDIKFIKEEVEHLNRYEKFDIMEWLEIIISIKKKQYSARHKEGRRFMELNDGIELLIKTTPYVGFDVKIKGCWLVFSGKNVKTYPAYIFTSKSKFRRFTS